MNYGKKYDNPSPRISARICSKLFFWWLWPLFSYGKDHSLKIKDLYNVLQDDSSKHLGNKLEWFWNDELDKKRKSGKKPRLLNSIWKTFGLTYFQCGGPMLFSCVVLKVLQPYFLGLLIQHFDPKLTRSTKDAYMFATGLIVVTFIEIVFKHHVDMKQLLIGMRLRVACSSLIYRKIMRLPISSVNQNTGGQIVNILANDVMRFDLLFLYLHYIWIMPIQGTLTAYLVWQNLGIASLAGILLMTLMTIPVQVFLSKVTSKLRSRIAVKTDERVKLMTEIINGIHVIKMYTWEKPFDHLVSLARSYEIKAITRMSYLRGVNISSIAFIGRTCLFFTIMVYVLQGQVISADKVFTTVQYFSTLQTLMVYFYPRAMFYAAEARVSIKRIETFLLSNEVNINVQCSEKKKSSSVTIKDASASWNGSLTKTLQNISIHVPQNNLYAIVGSVGAGKSSILKLILGELQAICGDIRVSGIVSYASQEPWLFPGSVRDNIIFGQIYKEEKYRNVIKACCLDEDFDRLPYSDGTYVGDRGTALSGGQCARINLARTLYRDADIYLLDDPFAAVDVHVGKRLFDHCVNGYLRGKTRIIVTHQMQHLKGVDGVILMNEGRVEYAGPLNNVNRDNLKRMNLLEEKEAESTAVSQMNALNQPQLPFILEPEVNTEKPKEEAGETDELIKKGTVSNMLFLKYFTAGNSYFLIFSSLFFFVLAQLVRSGSDYFLRYWTNSEEMILQKMNISQSSIITNNDTWSNSMKSNFLLESEITLYIYGSILIGCIITSVVKCLLFYKMCMNASKNIHNRMLTSILRTPISFYYKNPAGRILNRFSKDTGAMDESLPITLHESVEVVFIIIGIIGQVLFINPRTIFPIMVTGYLYWIVRNVYLSTAQNLKRLEGAAKSPILTHMTSSLAGLTTIRSFNAQKIVCNEFDNHQDVNTSAHYLILVTTVAFGFWLDLISIAFITFITYSFILLGNEQTYGGDVGLAITQILMLCGMLQRGIRQCTEVSTQVVSVERIYEFTKLVQEGPFQSEPSKKPNIQWPAEGKIKVQRLFLTYPGCTEPSLKNLNFTIEPGMKVGIVGRTGAGKSSFISALFRLIDFKGTVQIDGVNIADIGLHDLRKAMSIIPQEPVLFSATLRNNLDPYREYEDRELWAALEYVELNKAFVPLDHPIESGGCNLSVGQRQLLCLARAIVKKNKILILDEATASIDPVTDALIQKTIKNKFKNCTVLTIAHRLNTVMDNDKILVIRQGQVVEFDHPYILLQRNGYFASMVQQNDNPTLQQLTRICTHAYKEKQTQ